MIKLRILLVITVLGFLFDPVFSAIALAIDPPRHIAHAGGAINQQTYTNSLEALNENYDKGFRFFEIDFSWTVDGKLVAIHDWQGALSGMFFVPEGMGIPTETEFINLKMKAGLTQLNLKDVLHWAKDKGDVFIVTDVKDGNIKALRRIVLNFKELKHYIIPQVYSYQEYNKVNALGYPRIILTLYRMKIDPYEVVDFSKKNSPFAVTMPWKIATSGLAYYLAKNKTRVYAHTINDIGLFNELKRLGVFGIYTDSISPQN